MKILLILVFILCGFVVAYTGVCALIDWLLSKFL